MSTQDSASLPRPQAEDKIRASVDLPAGLYQEAMQLVRAGYYMSLADALRAGLREEVVRKRPAFYPAEGDDLLYRQRLDEMRRLIREAGGLQKTEEEIWDDLRRIREEVWQEKKAARSGHQ